MQFYPHNISTALIGNAVSASTAATGSFINNFSAIPINTVNTASLALNITGSRGADGTSVAVVGPKGATGTRGVTGFRGNSILLLSSEWHSGPPCDPVPVDCYSHVFYPTFVLGNERFCAFEEPGQTYYSTDLTLIDGSSKIYYNDICTTLASNSNPLGAYGPTAFAYSTDGAGTLQSIDSCPQDPF
jgi:hypothetical protein